MATLEQVRLEFAARRDAQPIAALSRLVIESGLQPAWTAQRVERRIRDPESTVLVARSPPWQVAGFAIMRFGDESAHLDLLAVAPPMQRCGLGRRLLTWLEESALVAGTFTITLELRADNAGAFGFYLSCGYVAKERMPAYYQGIEDAIRMTRDLRVVVPAP